MLRHALVLSLTLLPLGPGLERGAGAERLPDARAVETSDAYHQEIFFAVLEGLYRDGVSSEVARAITAVDPQSLQPSSFVPGCPICMPALDAFLLYLERPPFRGKKLARDTFGSGLPAEQVALLTGSDPRARREALRELMQRWVYEHLDRLRLDPVERGAWTRELAARAETGMAILAGLQRSGDALYGDFDECPLCLGAEAGSVAGG
jgi:hypothetical protein